MNTKSLDQIKDQYYGEVGTQERDTLERELDALRIRFKIRNAREKKEINDNKTSASPSFINR